MARSVISIDVNDDRFKEFLKLFDDYKAAVGELPGDWGKIDAVTDSTATHFGEMTAALMAQAEVLHRIDAAERTADKRQRQIRIEQADADKKRNALAKQYQNVMDHTNRKVKEVRENVAGIVSNVAHGTETVLKWIGLGGIASGLLGAGGLWGLDRLAGNAGESRRLAQGLDTTSGNEKAFALNFERLVEPQGYLSNIETVARTPALQYGVGADVAQMQRSGMDTADIGSALIPIIKKTFEQYGANANALQATGLDHLVSLQDAIRISKNSDADIATFQQNYAKGKGQLAVADNTLKNWQDLDRLLGTAGERIENILIKDLEALAPVIGHLSEKAVDLVDTWTKKLVPAVDDFATYLDSDKFKTDVRTFEDGVEQLGKATLEAARFLGLLERPAPDPKTATNEEITRWNMEHPDRTPIPVNPKQPYAWYDPRRFLDPNHELDTGKPGQGSPNDSAPFRWWLPDSYSHHLPGTAPWERGQLLDQIEHVESGGNPNAVSPKGAQGAYQLMPETAKLYGVKNPFDRDEARGGADRLLDHLFAEFDNDQRKAVAAYNWGDGNLKKDIDKYGSDWDKHLPKETDDYLTKVLGDDSAPRGPVVGGDKSTADALNKVAAALSASQRGGSPAVVTVQNATGGSAIVSTSQFPQ